MKIYHFNQNTGEFLFESDAIESPLEPGVYLIPAGATDIVPPTVESGKVAVFGNNQWTILSDFRGSKYWTDDGTEHAMESLGELPLGSITTPPPETTNNEKLSFVNNAWVITPDFIGVPFWYFDGTPGQPLKELGPLPANTTTVSPPAAPTQYATSFVDGAWSIVPDTYYTKRAAAYPAIGDLLDMIWHSIDQGVPLDKTSPFYAACAAVKNQFPKPTASSSTTSPQTA